MLGKIRTLNPQIRSLVFYPIELQALTSYNLVFYFSIKMICRSHETGNHRRRKTSKEWKHKICTEICKIISAQGVAQTGSASVLGTEGHRFKSCHLDVFLASN